MIALPGLAIPKGVQIHWHNYLEGNGGPPDKTRWTHISKSDDITNSSFKLKVLRNLNYKVKK